MIVNIETPRRSMFSDPSLESLVHAVWISSFFCMTLAAHEKISNEAEKGQSFIVMSDCNAPHPLMTRRTSKITRTLICHRTRRV
jgi:hypothetical protein